MDRIIEENFSEYEEYKNINKVINSFNEFKEINNKMVNGCNVDLKSEIDKYTNNIFNNFSDNQKMVLTELIEWRKNKTNDNEASFVNKVNDDEKRNIFDYIYWKREIDNDSIFKDFNLNLLKKIFNQKRNEAIFSDIKIKQNCPACKNEGILFMRDLNNKKGNYFLCKNCNHEVYKYEECECNFCKKIKDDIYKSLKENLVTLLKRIDNKIMQELDVVNNIEISDDVMLEDYKLYRLNLDKDIREVLSYKPNSTERLEQIINKINTRNRVYNKNISYKNDIYNKLIDNFVLYKVDAETYEKYKVERLANSETSNYFKFIGGQFDISYLEEFFKFGNLEEFEKNNILRINDKRILISDDPYVGKYIELDFQDGKDFFVEVLNKEYRILNKYFFDYDKDLKDLTIKRNTINVFQSNAERNMYIDLKNKYSNNIILINRPIKNIIDIDKLERELEIEELNYLNSNAEFNFALCDLEGNALKVIQVQKGDHHNEKEWIWRDLVKKKICKLCGVEYEEVF